jgi:hypothetical protein
MAPRAGTRPGTSTPINIDAMDCLRHASVWQPKLPLQHCAGKSREGH